MNTIFIVLPILVLLMFDLGLTLRPADFRLLVERPRAVLVGLVGQILLLPLIGLAVAYGFQLEAVFFLGVMLIACSPGGSSSNVFSMLAGGDVALSVSLTMLSSIITLFTGPLVMSYATGLVGENQSITLPVGNLLVQNIVLMLVPIVIGLSVAMWREQLAHKMHGVLKKLAFPALILLASIFFIQNRETIIREFPQLAAYHYYRDRHAERCPGYLHSQQSVCLCQRRDGYTGHRLCPDDEHHPAGVCRHH